MFHEAKEYRKCDCNLSVAALGLACEIEMFMLQYYNTHPARL